jgi:hypothetical protein
MITADTITPKQIRDACAIAADAKIGEFGTATNLYYLASRIVDDAQATSVYGERGVRNTIEARARCAEILNARQVAALEKRQPALLARFRVAVESLGLVY